MKLFEGFHIDGPEMRWIPPSPARGRPEGFWEETGHWVNGFYSETPLWFGGPAALIRAAIFKRDANGTPIYGACDETIWTGEQTQQKAGGDPEWEDIWIMPEQEPHDVEVAHGTIKVKWDRFDSTWITYLWQISPGLYMDRRIAKDGVKEPLTEERGCYPIKLESIWS